MFTTICPECHVQILIGSDPYIGQKVACPSCKIPLEIVWLFPLSLGYLEEDTLSSPSIIQVDEELHSLGS
ncbi:MAG: hypothetical protein GWN61_23165 [candidate division Zixibacteria bacterium]|nr:hypothetical protein [candidate division Zixibacteria bacterium]NIW49860.1 hypothetical protein [Gammaproteobacteria bacterium]NIR67425.1 hypothetical protein [candidate division Zixibacteria bacterium]NIS48764.1 hypothetical protein [candidate division Zixibacteria bacterium]NIU16831.1 hypothetical protein [candidate division Zixibacteria bacterium]